MNSYNRKRIRGKTMKKAFKVIAMLFLVTAVVFAAGCSSKTEENKTSVADNNVNVSTASAVTPDNNSSDDILADNNSSDDTLADNNSSDDSVDNSLTDDNNTTTADDNSGSSS